MLVFILSVAIPLTVVSIVGLFFSAQEVRRYKAAAVYALARKPNPYSVYSVEEQEQHNQKDHDRALREAAMARRWGLLALAGIFLSVLWPVALVLVGGYFFVRAVKDVITG